MLELARHVIASPYTGSLSLVNTEAMTMQLLCATVAHLSALAEREGGACSARERQAVSAARQLLEEQRSPAPTLRDLTRATGLPERTLTQVFKAISGETLFDYSLRCRMRHALILLRDQHYSVEQVSQAVGYSHATSFTAAFRRHFGMRPIDAKRTRR
jgi:AraC-like DNA-binding protein